jgi:hypothetical protein
VDQEEAKEVGLPEDLPEEVSKVDSKLLSNLSDPLKESISCRIRMMPY